jgi:gelsolin
MLKPATYNIADSNIAMLGTDLEKEVRQNAAKNEPAWTNAGKEVGIMIWRIEKFQVKEWPKEEYGSFFSGDSYIVLHTYKQKGSDALRWNVHFWLGAHTTQDEAGTAAYKTVELDDLLGGAPVQYREVQGHESAEFLALFPKGIKIMAGGIDTGFRHVEPTSYRPRLLHIKGTRKTVTAIEVPMNHTSMNEGDCFLLDQGMKVFIWQGKSAGIFEKNKAAELARAIDDERKSAVEITTTTQGADADFPWSLVGGKPDKFKPATPDTAPAGVKKLLKVSDASGDMQCTEVAEGTVKRDLLDSDDVFIFDCVAEVFVWIGKGSTKAERQQGIGFAQKYLKSAKRPDWLPIVRVLEGGENEVFESHFD